MLPQVPDNVVIAAAPILVLCLGAILAIVQSTIKSINNSKAISITFISVFSSSIILTCLKTPNTKFMGSSLLRGDIEFFGYIFLLSIGLFIGLLFKGTYLKDKFFKGKIVSIYLMVFSGMLTMISSNDVVTLIVGLELSSIGVYSLVGYLSPSRVSQEGAIKYFILGSFAAAILLFGFALLYASSGSLLLTDMANQVIQHPNHLWVKIGGVLVLTGLATKLALIPFHLWAPDTFESAPTGITALIATSVKITLIIITLKFLSLTMPTMNNSWTPILMFLAILSMIVGNLLAMVQNSIKRILAYSSIAHSGYIAVALCSISGTSTLPYQATFFYLIGYTLASLTAFGIIMWLENNKMENLHLNDLSGLAKKHPWASFGLAIALFSFAGLPPTVGFIGKFFVFSTALHKELYGLLLVGVIGSAISLYYYLKIIVKIYMTKENESSAIKPIRSILVTTLVGFTVVFSLLLGTIYPAKLMDSLNKPSENLQQNK